MDYYKKYLKYKTKFLNLKNLQYGGSGGGGSIEVNPIKSIEDKYKSQEFQVKCFTTGFKQHSGECWNDSIMMFLCNQDEIKKVVQRKLRFLSSTEIIQLALLKNRQKLLPSLYLEKEFFDKILTNLPDYLNRIKERFNYYYDYYNQVEEKQQMPKNFKGDASPRLGIECAKSGLKIFSAIGPGTDRIVSILIILSCFLLDDIELIFNIKSINKIKREDNNNIIAVYNLLKSEYDEGHASLFYICNGISYHFDDNEPEPKSFDFKSLLNSRITSIEKKTFDDDNVFTITYPEKKGILKTNGVILIKINEYTPEDLKNKMNTLFYLDLYHIFHSEYYVPLENRTEKPFELLIDKYLKLGFDINSYSDEYGNTLLHLCIGGGDTNLVRIKFLISKGLDVNLQNGDGNTILHIFVKILSGSYIYLKKWEDYGSDHMIKDAIDRINNLKLILQEILKLPNIRLDIKNYKGELANLVICPKCFYASTIDANFCENCGQQIKF